MRSGQHVADKTTPIQWPEACIRIMQDPAWSGLSRQAEDAKYYHFHAWRTLWFVPGVQVNLIQLELPGGLAGAGDLCPLDHGHVPGNPSPHLGWKSKCSVALVPHSAGQFTSSMPTLASCAMMMIVFAHTLLTNILAKFRSLPGPQKFLWAMSAPCSQAAILRYQDRITHVR